jgi:pimeloyl-ACP methyl ester carboxylesterase
MRKLTITLALAVALLGCGDDDDADQERDGSTPLGDGGRDAAGPPLDASAPLDASRAPDASRIDRSRLADTGTGKLDYEDRALWVCRPGNDPDECRDVDLDATEILTDGGRTRVPHVAASDAPFDCFYVYPTVATQGGGNMTNFADIAPVLDPLRAQAARFTRLCNVYAPLYRQVSLTTSSDAGVQRQGDPALALGDVLAAFDTYLSKWNQGRDFVILGHSQGTAMATELIRQRIDGDATLRAKLISAVLLGGQVRTPANARAGGTFTNIPTCATPGETGCVIAYVSYAKEAPPSPGKGLFGAETDAGVVACTEPAQLAKRGPSYSGSYFSKRIGNPAFAAPGYLPADLETPYMLYRNYFKGTCVNSGGFSYLEIEAAPGAGDTRMTPPYRGPALESAGWGLHIVDYNLELEDILEAVRLQANARQ